MAERPCITCQSLRVSYASHRLGGMTAPVIFNVGDDDAPPFAPLAVPPWEHEALPPSIPGHIRGLRGVFPCLPFGVSPVPGDALPGWRLGQGDLENPLHGPGANGLWTCTGADSACVEMRFEHGKDDALVWSSQSIAPDDGKTAVRFHYAAMPRRSLRLPFGFHVMLAWQDGMVLDPGPFAAGFTYPGTLPPGRMMTKPSSTFQSLTHVPGVNGPLDITRPRWSGPSEDVVMLCGTGGRFTVAYPSVNRRLSIIWDAAVMPHCLLWFSRFGMEDEPWRSRYTAIGVEPIAAAFDFLPAVSAGANPLAAQGFATAIQLEQGTVFETTLALEASSL